MPNVKGRQAQHLSTLAAFICAIVASGSTQLPKVARKICAEATPASREKRPSRWLNNASDHFNTYLLSVAGALLMSLAQKPLILVVDGTVVGRGCVALYVGVVYRKKLLPIAWTVVAHKKGHLPESVHVELMKKVRPLVPEGARVTLIGDGEFDGVNLQAIISHWQWSYVCRTAKSTILYWEGERFRFDDMIPHCERGEDFFAPGVLFTREKYGSVNAIAWWRKPPASFRFGSPLRILCVCSSRTANGRSLAWQIPKGKPLTLEQLKDMPKAAQRLLSDAIPLSILP